MKLIKHLIIFLFLLNLNNILYAKDPSALINEIVDEAAAVLSSDDPVESKIIKLKDDHGLDVNQLVKTDDKDKMVNFVEDPEDINKPN